MSPTDEVREAIDDVARAGAPTVTDIKHDAVQLGAAAKEFALAKTDEVKYKVREGLQCSEDYVREELERAEDYIHSQPFKAMGLAAFGGFVLGLWMRRR